MRTGKVALAPGSAYSGNVEARPVINLEETIGKTVGRRRAPAAGAGLQKTLNQVFASQGHVLCPRGVYRFKSHEEADEWMWKMMTPNKTKTL